jgi:hypothetical protein
LEPRFDWAKLRFKTEITDRVLFGNGMLQRQYLRRGGQVRDFFSSTYRLELALEWIDKYYAKREIRDRLLSWMVYVCLYQFRVDIMNNVKMEIAEEYREEAL